MAGVNIPRRRAAVFWTDPRVMTFDTVIISIPAHTVLVVNGADVHSPPPVAIRGGDAVNIRRLPPDLVDAQRGTEAMLREIVTTPST